MFLVIVFPLITDIVVEGMAWLLLFLMQVMCLLYTMKFVLVDDRHWYCWCCGGKVLEGIWCLCHYYLPLWIMVNYWLPLMWYYNLTLWCSAIVITVEQLFCEGWWRVYLVHCCCWKADVWCLMKKVVCRVVHFLQWWKYNWKVMGSAESTVLRCLSRGKVALLQAVAVWVKAYY